MDAGLDQKHAVKVNFYASLRPVVGGKTILVDLPEGGSIDCLLQTLIRDYPGLKALLFHADGAMHTAVHIFVNGRDAHLLPEHYATRLQPGDNLDIFPPVGGG